MLKDSYYFSHDANAHNDPKCVKLIMLHGLEGYGVYWVINEIMRAEKNTRLSLSDCNAIAYELHMQEDKVSKIIKTCIDIDLYTKDDKFFWSERLRRNVLEIKEKSENAKKAAKIRWKNANAMQPHSNSNALKERKGKEIKEKESKLKEIKRKKSFKNFKTDKDPEHIGQTINNTYLK